MSVVSTRRISILSVISLSLSHIEGVPAVPEFGSLARGRRVGEINIQIRTVASGVNSPNEQFRFVIAIVFAGITLSEKSFDFSEYQNGQFVSIPIGGIKEGASYILRATATNIFGSSESIYILSSRIA